jgi:hypothetical protein
MKIGDLVKWFGCIGIVIDKHKFSDHFKIQWADGAEPSWRRADVLEVVNESR